MPGCRDCNWYIAEQKKCGVALQYPGRRSPIRHCVIAILQAYGNLFQPEDRILEVGCGAWSPTKEHAIQKGARWFGFDVESHYQGRKTIASAVATVGAIPFPDQSFDWVVATQSMEHWEQYRVNLYKGLSELFRVLKPGGWALLNVPIFLHGSPRFMFGHLDDIRQHFEPFAEQVVMEAWRHPHEPLPPYRPFWPQYWYKPLLRKESAYILDIRAQRKKSVPYFDYPSLSWWERAQQELWYRTPLYYMTYGILKTLHLGRRALRQLSG